MCGIAGTWSPRLEVHRRLAAALEKMRHRGPDDRVVADGNPVSLAMCRLAIIDVAGGRQPAYSQDGSVAVVCNGEIYNYVELRSRLESAGHVFRSHSDTEVIPHLYQLHGDACVDDMLGMWGFAAWDERARRLLLSRDRLGKKPLYYATAPGELFFASELKALRVLLDAAGVTPVLDDRAIYDYLSLGYVPQPGTVFSNVRCVPPGANVVFDGERVSIRQYWSLPQDDSPRPVSVRAAAAEFRDLVGEATRIRLRSDVPVGIFLSGGIDSSIVAFEAARGAPDLHAFTVSMPDRAIDETGRASAVARRLGLRHTILPLRMNPVPDVLFMAEHCDQPFYDSSFIASRAVSRLAREHVTVVLNGDGGDEVLTGYRQHYAAHVRDRFPLLSRGLAALAGPTAALGKNRRSRLGFAGKFAAGVGVDPGSQFLAWSRDLLREEDKIHGWIRPRPRPTEEGLLPALGDSGSALARVTRGALLLNLPGDFLVKMDLASMAASVEARSPLLDHRVVEAALTLPSAVRFAGMRRKALAYHAYRDVLPAEVFGRKQGFEVPVAQWLRHDLRELVADTLGAPGAAVREYLAGTLVDRLVADPTGASRNAENLTFALLMLELWLRGLRPAAVA